PSHARCARGPARSGSRGPGRAVPHRPHAARATWPGGAGPGGGRWALLLLGVRDGGARISVRGEAVTVPPHHAPVPMGRSTHRPPVTWRIASSAGATADVAVGRRRGCDDRGDRDRGARGAVGAPRTGVDRALEPGVPGP